MYTCTTKVLKITHLIYTSVSRSYGTWLQSLINIIVGGIM